MILRFKVSTSTAKVLKLVKETFRRTALHWLAIVSKTNLTLDSKSNTFFTRQAMLKVLCYVIDMFSLKKDSCSIDLAMASDERQNDVWITSYVA